MPPTETATAVVTNYRQRYTLQMQQGDLAIMPCNANHIEHEGKMYASQSTGLFARKNEN